jgi:hypothetical protein
MNARFWSETGFVFNDVTPGYPGGYKWNFFTANGNQTAADGEANYFFHAIALHDGKIATSVPEPSINLLLFVGLGSLGVIRALFRFGVKV